MIEGTTPNPQVTTRLEPDIYGQVQRLAAELFDGNMAMLARIAIKRYVAANRAVLVAEPETERELAEMAS